MLKRGNATLIEWLGGRGFCAGKGGARTAGGGHGAEPSAAQPPGAHNRPAWLDAAHKALDMAVAQAYGWSDYTANLPDEEILKRLLALNLERAA